MIDIFTRLYNSVEEKNIFFKKAGLYALERFLIRVPAQLFIPAGLQVTGMFGAPALRSSRKNKRLIVSLTTFPPRINKLWIVLESVFRQSLPPDKIILWLSEDQFRSEEALPRRLKAMRNRGLEIVFCKGDLRSHKKYVYALKEYPDDFLLTIDDDLLYPSWLFRDLMEAAKKNPGTICGNRVLRIAAAGKEVLPYDQWKIKGRGVLPPSSGLFFTSGGGTLFPPGSFYSEATNHEVFMDCCPYADDVWLNAMAGLQGTRIKKTDRNVILLPLLFREKATLMSLNLEQKQNDVQLLSVRNHYGKTQGKDPLSNLWHGG